MSMTPAALGHSNNAVGEKLAVNLHIPDGAFLFQVARTAATRPRKKVSSRVSGSGRATTRWRTNSPGARGWRATIISGTGRRGSNDSGASRLPQPSRATPAAVSSSNPDLHAYINRDHPLISPTGVPLHSWRCVSAFLSHACDIRAHFTPSSLIDYVSR